MAFPSKRGTAGLAGLLGLSLALAACGGGDDDGGGGGGAAEPIASPKAGCEAYANYGDLTGKTVTLYTSIVAPEDAPYVEAFKPFEECTGATVTYEGSKEFEAQIIVRVRSGNPPDVALFPQPGLLQSVVRDTGKVLEAPEAVVENVDKYYGEDWKAYGTVDGKFYAAPNSANAKSFVWYSPKAFADAGYEVPQTWDEMIALSDEIVAAGQKPWCAGIGSGDATGWPTTDWMEDVMLRLHGPDVYDQWVNHEIPFNDPKVLEVLQEVGKILKNEDYVNGGLGDVQSIASTTFQDGGLPILKGQCWMHRQASFYQANWPEGTTVGADGDVFAFYLPPISEEFGRPQLGGGEFVAAFADRPEVQSFQAYMASPEFVNERAKQGNFISANTELDPANVDTEVNKLSVELLTDPEATFRFDASDLMPGAVGAGSFWTEMTAWIANDKDDQAVLDAIEGSWPS